MSNDRRPAAVELIYTDGIILRHPSAARAEVRRRMQASRLVARDGIHVISAGQGIVVIVPASRGDHIRVIQALAEIIEDEEQH